MGEQNSSLQDPAKQRGKASKFASFQVTSDAELGI